MNCHAMKLGIAGVFLIAAPIAAAHELLADDVRAALGISALDADKQHLLGSFLDAKLHELDAREEALFMKAKADSQAAETKATENAALAAFRGLNLGAAFAVFFYDDDNISKAEVIGGVVRVTRRESQDLKYLLEAHFFPKLFLDDRGGVGPFFAVAADDEDIVDAIGAGVMVGFRRSKSADASLNFGAGFFMDTNSRVLGGGLREGAALPNGETEIRYEEKGKTGFHLLFSFAW
ncbi:MAG: hypothetical protein DHS20C21_11360 [Gemmatimonadota bacterium]|nr:MAG: hypothetical protein DHS20C21_11360 [Gemmatimonadota bacterium]